MLHSSVLRFFIALSLVATVYLGYHWYTLKAHEVKLLDSLQTVVTLYEEMNQKYIQNLLKVSDLSTSEKALLEDVAMKVSELKQKNGLNQVKLLMQAQESSFVLFDSSGSTLNLQSNFSLWRHESSQNGKVFPKIVEYNKDAKIFNYTLEKPLIFFIAWLQGLELFPIIDVNGKIYHEAVLI